MKGATVLAFAREFPRLRFNAVEPARLLSAAGLEDRISTYFRCHHQEYLIAQQAA